MVKCNKLPTQEKLKTLFTYDPETGDLMWKAARNGATTLVPIRSPDSGGRYRVGIDGTRFSVHRVIWKYLYDTEPNLIDHVDGDPKNNKISNLRKATYSQNSQNKKVPKEGCTSKYRGVKKNKYGGWSARIQISGKRMQLGTFPTEEEAANAYKKAAENYFGEFQSNR